MLFFPIFIFVDAVQNLSISMPQSKASKNKKKTKKSREMYQDFSGKKYKK